MSPIPSTSMGLEELFRQHVQTEPDADAVVEGAKTLSYQELDALASCLAAKLCELEPQIEEPIGLLLPMGIANIVAQIAILRVGASCVPLDLSFPDQRIHSLYNNLDIRIVITKTSESHRFQCFEHIILGDNVLKMDEYNAYLGNNFSVAKTDGAHRTHVLHTSGTTGQPKSVEILSKGIVSMAYNTFIIKLRKFDRMAQISAPSFDATLLEVWATLVTGGTMVVLPKEVVTDPWALCESLKLHRITGITVTTTLLQHIVSVIPHAFASLDWVISGGEAANSRVFQSILEHGPPKKLINGYGPTECTTMAAAHVVTLEECKRGIVPIGRAIDSATLYILDEKKNQVKAGDVGEIYIGGDAVSRGYYNPPEANAKSFVSINHLSKSGESERFYKTGDLARYLDNGIIEFVGRADNLIKIRGFRIDLIEIQNTILESGMVNSAIILPINRPGKETHIVAFIIGKDSGPFLPSKLDAYMRHILPPYMIPRTEILQSSPRTAHGKADCKGLINEHLQNLEKAGEYVDPAAETAPECASLWLRRLWSSLLGIYNTSDESNFFELGGSSLQASVMLVNIRQRYNLKITLRQVYDAPVLKQLAKLIDDGAAASSVEISKLNTFVADSKLASGIYVLPGKVSDWRAPEQGRVFVTGTTGFLGKHFLRDIIDRPDVKEVRCLVRAPDAASGHLRLISKLQEAGLDDTVHLNKIVAVAGDLDKENFGLSVAEFSELAAWASVIFHIGAHVNYVLPYEVHRSPNVIGTLNCIRLATTAYPKALHCISTGVATGPISHFTNRSRIMEDEDNSSFIEWLPYDLGYTQSKWVAEQLVRSMQAKGLHATIYRPGLVMGDGNRGKVNYDDFMSLFTVGCLKLGYRPILSNHSKAMVTVDFVSAAIIHISANPKNFGQTFHVVPQTAEEVIDMEAAWGLLDQIGYTCEPVPYKEWVEILTKDRDVSQNPLFSMLPILQEQVHNGLTRLELWENMVAYDTTRCRQALLDMEVQRKSGVDLEFLKNYINTLTMKG